MSEHDPSLADSSKEDQTQRNIRRLARLAVDFEGTVRGTPTGDAMIAEQHELARQRRDQEMPDMRF